MELAAKAAALGVCAALMALLLKKSNAELALCLGLAAGALLLDRLAGKDFVSIRTIDAPTPYKVVTPLVTRDEYSSAASDSFISRIFAGKWQGLIANLVDAGKITDDDIAEIERIIGEGTKK